MPALPLASFPENIWDADTDYQDRRRNDFQSDPKAQDYQRIASEIIATQTELRRVQRIVEAEDNLVTSNTTLDETSELVLVDASNGPIVLTLPDSSTADGAFKRIKKIDNSGYPVTVLAAGSDTIDDETSKVILFQWSVMAIQATGSGAWYIV